jgi:hypothetical protein
MGVILSAAASQAEGRISRADRRCVPHEIPHPAELRRDFGMTPQERAQIIAPLPILAVTSVCNSEVFLCPLVEAVERLLQVVQRIGDAEAKIAFAEFTEGGAGKRGHSGLFEQSVG